MEEKKTILGFEFIYKIYIFIYIFVLTLFYSPQEAQRMSGSRGNGSNSNYRPTNTNNDQRPERARRPPGGGLNSRSVQGAIDACMMMGGG